MPKLTVTRDDLEAWLEKAANAHHRYEEEIGRQDENWAAWYAFWIFDNHPKVREGPEPLEP